MLGIVRRKQEKDRGDEGVYMEENRRKKVTIKDIAREAGISTAAVSLILNNKPCRILEEKKQLVREVAKRENYVVNQAAKSLATRKSHMLALILPDIENTFFSSLAKQIENRCRREGYSLIIASSDERRENDEKLLRVLESRGVDGVFLILSIEALEQRQKLLEELSLLSMPYVMIDRTLPDAGCAGVSFDHEQGGYLAAKYLITQGHTKIGCVYRDDKAGSGKSRLVGYMRALSEHGILVREEYLKKGDYRMESGYHAAGGLLATDCTAAFICNDMMTLGFLRRLYEEGCQVPRDYSIVSYDDSLKNYLLGLELTTVVQDIEMLAGEACRLLFGRLADGEDAPKSIVLAPKLTVRGSVRFCGI